MNALPKVTESGSTEKAFTVGSVVSSIIARDVTVSLRSGNGPVEYSLIKTYLNLLAESWELSHSQTSIFSSEL
ncbi:hypothetical protein ES703_125540 [subsurface metagenome]